MAVMWWSATGTWNKMESDVGNHFKMGNPYWIHRLIHKEEPLELHHVLLAILMLGFGLVFSKCVFFAELMSKRLGKYVRAHIHMTASQWRGGGMRGEIDLH